MIRDTSSQDQIIEPRRGWTRNRIILVAIAASLLGAGVLAWPTWRRWASAEQTVSVDRLRLARVTRGTLTRDISAEGKVVAAIKPTLFSPAIGVVSLAVQGARRNHRHSGLCGQAPSDYPEFAEFLVKEGIDSISLNPDSVLKITLKILDLEKNL